jgi:hypothetical protein
MAPAAHRRGAVHNNAPGPLRVVGAALGNTTDGAAAAESAAEQPAGRAGADQRATAVGAAHTRTKGAVTKSAVISAARASRDCICKNRTGIRQS